MRFLPFALGLTPMLGVGLFAVSAHAPMDDDERAIRNHIENTYFAGPRTGNGELASKAFAPTLVMYWVRDGTIMQLTRDEWVARVVEGSKTRTGPDQTKRRILEVDVTGTAAMAKVELEGKESRTVDYMSLLKVNGQWIIVGKVFDRASTTKQAASQ